MLGVNTSEKVKGLFEKKPDISGQKQETHKAYKGVKDEVKAKAYGKDSEEANRKREERKEKAKNKAVDLEQAELLTELEFNPQILGTKTPAEWKAEFERLGLEVKPLGQGTFRGVRFEDGGGYRVTYGGDGYFQYHPKEGSHHEGSYYKFSDAKRGIRRYGLDGQKRNE